MFSLAGIGRPFTRRSTSRALVLEPFLLLLLVAAAFLIRLWGLSLQHFWDEMVYLQNAQVIAFGKTNYSELAYRPPLLSLLFAGAFRLWHHIFAACILTALINALAPLFLYRAGAMLFGRLSAALSALLLAFGPFFVGVFPAGFDSDNTGNSLLTDSPALTLVLLALWLMLRALARPSALRFAGAGFVLALAVLMRFGSLPAAGLLFLLSLATHRRLRALAAAAAGFALAFAPYLLWSRLVYKGIFATLSKGWGNVEGSSAPFLFYVRNAPTLFTPLALAGLLLAACWPLVRRLRPAGFSPCPAAPLEPALPLALLHGFLWFWLAAALLFFSSIPHKEPRYILPLAPPLLLLAGSGLAPLACGRRRSLQLAGAALLAASLVVAFLPLSQRLQESFLDPGIPDELVASQYLNTIAAPGSTLYMSFNYPAFAYYTRCRIHEMPQTGPALQQEIDRIPPGGLLVVYRPTREVTEPDPAWVDTNPRFERLRSFPTLIVYRHLPLNGPPGNASH